MTNREKTIEEAINTLNSLKQYYNDKNEDSYVGFDDEDNEALDMAIKALEQTMWIPCSKRLPEKQGCYLVTTKWKGSYTGDIYIETNMAVYRKQRKEWDCVDIIAWMPQPEPYRESEGSGNEET